MHKPIKKAVLPVGGLGTRFLPATKSIPKEMLPVANKPLVQYAFEEAVEAGIEQFIFITGRNKNAISNHFDHAYELESVLAEQNKHEFLAQVQECIPTSGNIAYVRQQVPLGLGHAVWCARNFIGDEPFAVLLSDEMVLSERGLLSQMVEAYNEVGGNIIAVADVPRDQTSKYGILDPEGDTSGNIIKAKGMVEKPKPEDAPSTLSLNGRYILQPKIFEYLSRGKKTTGGEVQLTDSMNDMMHESPFHGFKFEGKRFDCGSVLGFTEANIAYTLEMDEVKDQIKEMLKKYI